MFQLVQGVLNGRLHSADYRLTVSAGLLSLLLVSLAVYWPHLTDFFALDDYIWLRAASEPNPLDFFRRAFSFAGGTTVDPATPFWRPLIDSYFFAGWRVFGLDPFPYHLTNIVLHVANAFLACVLVWQVTSSKLTGLLAGLIFAVLPTYDLGVTWISQATELLAVLFFMLGLVSYAAYLRGSHPASAYYIGALLSLVFALLSKESAVTLPVALAGLVLVVEVPRTRKLALHRAEQLAPFAAITLAYFILLYIQEYTRSSNVGLYEFGWHAAANVWEYLQWMALPLPDSFAPWIGEARPLCALGFLVLGGWTIIMRSRLAGFAFVWTLVALLPYSFFLTGIELRYTYMASIPFAIFAAALASVGFSWIMPRLGVYPAISAACILVICVAAFLGVQARDRQSWISQQSEFYSELYHQAPALCGPLPQGSHIILLDSPIWDVYGRSSAMALNLLYDHVFVHRVERSQYPGLAAYVSNKCVLEYTGQHYGRVDGG